MYYPPTPNSGASSSSPGSPTSYSESPNSPNFKPTTYQKIPPSRTEAAFVCTVCWQHQPSGTKPKLLGTSARIVCRACWRAVLDLSICWVCGECIVRGDEVVSLGWCFWHRGCFGCLVCRTRMGVPGSEDDNVSDRDTSLKVRRRRRELGRWDSSGDDGHGKRRDVGVELETIPLCSVCSAEAVGASRDQLLEKGLECVTSFDGGLSRDRLDMLFEEREGEITLYPKVPTRNPRRLRGVTSIEQDLKRYINASSGRYTNDILNADLSSLLDNAADMGKSDGRIVNEQRHSDKTMINSEQSQQEEERNDAYVSVFNPVGEPAFKPSKTKPLPRWMNLLPNNVRKERGQQPSATLEHVSQDSPGFELPTMGREADPSDGLEDLQASPIALVDIPNLRGGGKVTGVPTLPVGICHKSHTAPKDRNTYLDRSRDHGGQYQRQR